jgi:hypothetical protein
VVEVLVVPLVVCLDFGVVNGFVVVFFFVYVSL